LRRTDCAILASNDGVSRSGRAASSGSSGWTATAESALIWNAMLVNAA
jgi:hypothetical protein